LKHLALSTKIIVPGHGADPMLNPVIRDPGAIFAVKKKQPPNFFKKSFSLFKKAINQGPAHKISNTPFPDHSP
jgi:hypothetical protein